MFTKNNHWLPILAAILLAVLFAVYLPTRATAAQSMDTVPNSCLSCHEDLYYLYDTGSHYCLAAHADRCTNCHQGNNATVKQEEAHIGLLARPQENDGAKCRECHTPQEARDRMTTFALQSGGFGTVLQEPAYISSVRPSSEFPEVPQESGVWPWLAGAAVLFGLWLALVLLSPVRPR